MNWISIGSQAIDLLTGGNSLRSGFAQSCINRGLNMLREQTNIVNTNIQNVVAAAEQVLDPYAIANIPLWGSALLSGYNQIGFGSIFNSAPAIMDVEQQIYQALFNMVKTFKVTLT